MVEALELSGPAGTPVVLDLASVEYLSSAGFEALEAAASSRQLIVCSLADPVRMAWTLAGDSSRIQIEPSVEHALATLSHTTADEASTGR